MTPAQGPLWKLAAEADDRAADALESLIAEDCVSFARFEARPTSAGIERGVARLWRIEALSETAFDAAGLTRALRDLLAPLPAPPITVEPLPEIDWLALNRAQFPPVAAGRFFVHGSHFAGAPPVGSLALRLDAGPAFGSGTHDTTKGCLIAIDDALRDRAPRTALDLGCGSGILALAIAKAAGIVVVASDIDPIAAATTMENAAANGMAGRVVALAGAGVLEEVRRRAPYDLIVANILAEPLVELAPAVAGLLAEEGRLVLSGLLTTQEPMIDAAYRAAGLTPGRIIVLGDWSTMILSRGV